MFVGQRRDSFREMVKTFWWWSSKSHKSLLSSSQDSRVTSKNQIWAMNIKSLPSFFPTPQINQVPIGSERRTGTFSLSKW
jgi:hypothetical protein